MSKTTRNNILIIITVLLVLTGIGIGAYFTMLALLRNTEYANLFSWITGIIFPALITFVVWIFRKYVYIKDWKLTLKKLKSVKNEEYIRISFAYLFRIKTDGKYLLVKNGQNIEVFQPVGGAYKCYDDEKKLLTIKYQVLDDDCIPSGESSKNDYRMRVPKCKLKKFVSRFCKYNDNDKRENITDLSREFREELVKNNIITDKNFATIKYRFCGRHFSDISFSEHFQCYELLIADIVELIPTESQEMEFRALKSNKQKGYYWATEEEISSRGCKKGTRHLKAFIANHTFKILPKNEKLLNKKKPVNREYFVNTSVADY